ncbi:glycosyltransferase [Silvanigrella paludirubra]|uniref:Glycosyltransferase n=1 Tax=Silvanigrella paludirubra TaxID=2499159 RepID=A0A6N6VX04_9BACT|nr:glycosyltransferase [Silvanigrella paludirubra]KAB8041023.1 glycosyltransferase [Silvanigrella paludirubra]
MNHNDKEHFQLQTQNFKVAIVHDWMFSRRGGERVLEQILNLFPQADFYYLFGKPKEVLKLKHAHKFIPSFLSKIPFIEKLYKLLLPMLPIAAESFDLSNYDLIISSSSCVAKGIIPPPLAIHISYIHSPMRYAWDQEHRYFSKAPKFSRPLEILRRFLLNRLRIWDVTSAVRIDKMITNSNFVARRCALYYGKTPEVVYPPINIKFFNIANQKEVYSSQKRKVLLFGAWTPYKKMYESLKILLENGIPVIAAGQGSELLKAQKDFSKKVTFYINPKDDEIPNIYSQAHTLLFPAIEDFGIVPLEATAAGLWVVAPNQGGTKETVINNVTGFTFDESSKESMINAVKLSLKKEITLTDKNNMFSQVEKFSEEIFQKKFTKTVLESIQNAKGF